MEDINDVNKRRLEAKIKKIKKSSISEKNKHIILDYRYECFSYGLSSARILKYMHYLAIMAGWLNKDFDKCTKEDIKRLVAQIEQTAYADETKKEMKIYIRKLFMWLRDTDEYPPEVKWIKILNRRNHKHKLPEDMLTEEEIQRMILFAPSTRDKALISMLYETGCRISELRYMQIKSIKFDERGATISVPSVKTGPRRIRILSSVPLLTAWLNIHPQRDNPSSYIWLTSKGNLISYGSINGVLRRIAKKANVKKKVNPHNFRHSRATYLANYLTEAQMKEYFGWIQASDMASIYVHLSGRDVDSALLRVYGIKTQEEKKESILTPKICPRCEMSNPSLNKFCSKCGAPLDRKTEIDVISNDIDRQSADSLLDELLRAPEFRQMFIDGMRKLIARKQHHSLYQHPAEQFIRTNRNGYP